MASPRPDSPDGDRLQRIIDGVYQETTSKLRLPYKVRQSNVRKVGRAAANLARASINDDSDSEETFVPTAAKEDTMAPSPTLPPAKKRKREDLSASSVVPVSATLATGIDPVDFTMTKTCALEDADTMPKLKKLLSSLFPHELKALNTAPEQLKLLAYRFITAGQSEWTAVTTASDLRDYMVTVKGNGARSVRLQICVLEEDAGVEGPLLLGRAGKNLRGEGIELGEVEEDEENGIVMVTKKQQLASISDEMSLAAVEGERDAANEMLEEKDEKIEEQAEEIKALKEEIKALGERLGDA